MTASFSSSPIAVIGGGSWATALAKILTDNGHKVHWWLRKPEDVAYLAQRRHNKHYLTAVRFVAEDTIFPQNSLASVVAACDILIIAVPSAYVAQVIDELPTEVWQAKTIVSAIKGILPDSYLLLCDYLMQQKGIALAQYTAITGPCHAEEVALERLSYLTFSSINEGLAANIASLFHNHYLFTTYNTDIWGAQFAAVLKNIYAVGAGMAKGLDYGDNFLSVLITNCYSEMYAFLTRHFAIAHPTLPLPNFHTSAYLGDLLVTSYSMHSRNRTLGNMLGKGYTLKNAILEMNMVAEGYFAAKGMNVIASKLGIDIPIATLIYQMLWEEHNVEAGFKAIEKMMF